MFIAIVLQLENPVQLSTECGVEKKKT